MSRLFDTNLSNYLSVGVSTFANVAHGKWLLSVSAWIYPTAVSTAAANDNGIFTAINNSSSVAFALNIDATGGSNKVRLNGRALSSDTRVGRSSLSTLSLNSWSHVGGLIDYAGGAIDPILNGVSSNSGSVTFGSTFFNKGTPTAADTIGGFAAPPTTAAAQFQGRIAELAIWGDISLTADEWKALGKGFSPRKVRFKNLLFYWPLVGAANPEPELIRGAVGTVTGSVPKSRHPRVII